MLSSPFSSIYLILVVIWLVLTFCHTLVACSRPPPRASGALFLDLGIPIFLTMAVFVVICGVRHLAVILDSPTSGESELDGPCSSQF
jgi:hypothetical protein